MNSCTFTKYRDKIYPYMDKKKTFGKHEREVKLCIEQEKTQHRFSRSSSRATLNSDGDDLWK